jgi:hypothetical protein
VDQDVDNEVYYNTLLDTHMHCAAAVAEKEKMQQRRFLCIDIEM